MDITREMISAGAYKNEYGVQRGSIMDMVVYRRPLTPNIGATENAKDGSAGSNQFIKDTRLPISYHDETITGGIEGRQSG